MHLLPHSFADLQDVCGPLCVTSVLAVHAPHVYHHQACGASMGEIALSWLVHMSRCLTNVPALSRPEDLFPEEAAPIAVA